MKKIEMPTRESKNFLGQHRTIWQEAPAWIFGSIQGLENEGILYVFLVFHTELQLKSLKKILIA